MAFVSYMKMEPLTREKVEKLVNNCTAEAFNNMVVAYLMGDATHGCLPFDKDGSATSNGLYHEYIARRFARENNVNLALWEPDLQKAKDAGPDPEEKMSDVEASYLLRSIDVLPDKTTRDRLIEAFHRLPLVQTWTNRPVLARPTDN